MTLERQASELPTQSGVYLWKDAAGVVLYVGKAKSLRARVRQYLSGHDGRFMVRFLVAQATQIDCVLTTTEKEALLLENTLIKQHKPPYNVKLRDDKNFLHVRIDPRTAWPQFELVRKIKDDGSKTFGPYHSAQKARRTLEFLQRSFPLRTCSDSVLKSRKTPCLLHQMGRCVAPCVDGHTTPQAYDAIVQESILVLGGRSTEAIERIRTRMRKAAEELRFEEAARLRDLATEIEQTLQRQNVVDGKLGDRDVWGLFREGDRGVIAVLPMRAGMLMEPWFLDIRGEDGDLDELLSSWVNTAYSQGFIPPDILLPELPSAHEALEEVLTERRRGRVHIRVPQRGDKKRLLELADSNARDRFRRKTDESERRQRTLNELRDICGLTTPPYRIECVDNSNNQGTDPVASCVVFLDGKPGKKEYRHYKIKTVVGSDDYASMREVLIRRFRRAARDGVFPDLLVVDGGKGQLGVALAVLEELGFPDQPVIGLAKPRTEKRRGEFDAVDKIILPSQPDPVILPDNSGALNLLRFIRNESHRFAIQFHRRTRRKSAFRSALDSIPGVGGKRRKALLEHFGSLKKLQAASVEEIAACPGIGPKLAEEIVRLR
ncbi:MAG: excinuclease ABC subunit UvrC [Proteobacteria bacterium]|nr:excinuclease ABC subunit UvrC [Pseudomonadota bacterium]MCP4915934.1 excinuclease ABC subunit UvrC [Pseudomonadota bacterium]